MHEYSLIQALLDRVAEEARKHDAVAVHHIRVKVGRLAQLTQGDEIILDRLEMEAA